MNFYSSIKTTIGDYIVQTKFYPDDTYTRFGGRWKTLIHNTKANRFREHCVAASAKVACMDHQQACLELLNK